MNLTIQRSKWLRGEGSSVSVLLRSHDGKMCCLGFLALAIGIPQDKIVDIGSPSRTHADYIHMWPSRLLNNKLGDVEQIIVINDTMSGYDSKRREEELKPLFYKLGVTLTFED